MSNETPNLPGPEVPTHVRKAARRLKDELEQVPEISFDFTEQDDAIIISLNYTNPEFIHSTTTSLINLVKTKFTNVDFDFDPVLKTITISPLSDNT